MDKTLAMVKVTKVTKESQTVLDWYVVSVSTEKNFSQIFEAISAASNHALLNNTCFTEKLRIDDYKDGRVSSYRIFQI